MNTVKGIIRNIRQHELFRQLAVEADGSTVFHVLTLELKESFREKGKVALLFKESDVMLVKGRLGRCSMENGVPCTVTSIAAGAVLADVEVASPAGRFRVLISRTACERLALAAGDRVSAFVAADKIALEEL
jgi:molybdate transport system regulatory protein